MEQEIPTESINTFCCIEMLASWYETIGNVSVDAIITAIDIPHVGLQTKISTIKTALTNEYVPTEKNFGSPPEKIEQPYVDMLTKFCLELNKSQHRIADILTYLKLCYINSEVLKEISDFSELVKSFERNKLLHKADLSWLKNITHHVQCTKATEVIEDYEKLLIADKIPWYSSHPKGTFLVGKIGKKFEIVTIKDSSNAKSAASGTVHIEETDSILDSSEVGSVIFYWRIVNKDVPIQIPEVVNTSAMERCKIADLTHIGVMIDGDLNLKEIDEIGM